MKSLMQFFRENITKKLIIFGAGSLGQKSLDFIPYEVAYLVDNSSKIWGETFKQKEIKNPAVLIDEKLEEICILVMSSFYSEISKQLSDLGFTENKHFFNGYQMLGALCNSVQQIYLDYPVKSMPRYGYSRPPHKRIYDIINRNRENYRTILLDFQQYADKLKQIELIVEDNCSTAPRWCNGFLTGLDAVSVYCFLDIYKPNIYMEIGSGNSTKFAKKAILDHNLDTQIISIDPCPRAEINSLCDKIIRQPLEEVDIEIFNELGENDILFFDGSHRSFMNSDVVAFFLDILPNLNSGVLVHIHDVFLPYDYPIDWEDRYYSEQYLLACYLLAENPKYQILFPSCFITQESELSNVLLPLWKSLDPRVQGGGGSFWLRIN